MKEIYLAGGCYWGVEKYLSNIKGVMETTVGFANGDTHHPTYEQVRYENTGHAETVKVIYDENQVPLTVLLKLFYRIIDPVSVDKQGEDEGHQYRTGIYFTHKEDEEVICASFRSSHQEAPVNWSIFMMLGNIIRSIWIKIQVATVMCRWQRFCG